MSMRYAAIRSMDVSNGAGLGVALFTQGCRNHCPHCQNFEQWTFDGGEIYTQADEEKILELCGSEWCKRFSVLGGEPLEPENHEQLLNLLSRIKNTYPNIAIWLYTGLILDELFDDECRCNTPYLQSILNKVDVIVDGPYIEGQKNIALRFAGSENQRIIDMNKSRQARRIVLWEDDPIFAEHEKEQVSKVRNDL